MIASHAQMEAPQVTLQPLNSQGCAVYALINLYRQFGIEPPPRRRFSEPKHTEHALWLVEEAAGYWRVSKFTVYRRCREGRIQSIPLGSDYPIPQVQVIAGVAPFPKPQNKFRPAP